MDLSVAAQGFAAMGSDPRLEVLRLLVRAGPEGLSVGEIQARSDIPASTLAHHLKALRDAGLIDGQKSGRSILNTANFDHLQNLAAFIVEECCIDAKEDVA